MSSDEVAFDCTVCGDTAEFFVFERWDDDGVAAVEAEDPLCGRCVEDAEPQHLDDAYANYVFKIDPISEAFGMTAL